MNLRYHASRFIGQPIVAHHVNGTVYRGILHGVNDAGMYIRPHQNRMVSCELQEVKVDTAEGFQEQELEVSPVFFGFGAGFGFVPWGGVAGFWGGGFWF